MCVIKVTNASYDRYEELIMRREELKKECLLWSSKYTLVFGELTIAIFKEKLLCAKKKKAIEYCQASLNKVQRIDTETLQNFVNDETRKLQDNLKDLKFKYEESQNWEVMTGADFAKLKKLFYKIAKLIHPDINPKMKHSEELQNLWNLAALNYQQGKLKELEEIELLVGKALKKLDGDVIDVSIPDIDDRIKALESEITEILTTNPYMYRILLSDPDLVEQKKEQMRQELKSYKDHGIQLDKILMDYLPEGELIRWSTT